MSQPRTRHLAASLATLAGVVVFLIALGLASRAARDALMGVPAFTIAIADISVPEPPGQSHEQFLGEVQYLGAFPERLPVLDPELPRHLTEAFRRHPWVAQVVRVSASRDGIRAELEFRRPELIVNETSLVDHDGRRLPTITPLPTLPRLLTPAEKPTGPIGSLWGDDRVSAAATIVAKLNDPKLRGLKLDGTAWVLLFDDRQVIWGRSPGEERPGEPDVESKLRRLANPTVGDLSVTSSP